METDEEADKDKIIETLREVNVIRNETILSLQNEINTNQVMRDDEKKSQYYGKYSWVIDSELLSKMIDADNGQKFGPREFKMDTIDVMIEIWPKGEDKDEE
eukprot:159601_1